MGDNAEDNARERKAEPIEIRPEWAAVLGPNHLLSDELRLALDKLGKGLKEARRI